MSTPSLVLLLSFVIGISSVAAERPNILFLLSDDHSAPYLGCYGNPDVRTPALDKLAAEGIAFDRFFTSCPQCVPSRAALMTGRSPVAVRMVRFTSPLPSDIPALPDLLRDQGGYFTGIAGRGYHLDGPATGQKGAPRAAPVMGEVMDRLNLRTFKKRADYFEEGGGGMKDFGGKLAKFLDLAPKGKPWFFWLGFSDPHHVWDTVSSKGKLDPAKITLPPHLPDLPGVREDLARYLQEVEHLDEDVQTVLDVLDKRGLAKNTLVIFIGDNGMAMPHGKGYLTDPGINTPCIVRWPGVIQPGQKAHNLLSGEDFTPTMLEAAGVTVPKEMSGVSFVKQLRGESFEPRKHIFAERGPHGGDGGMKPDVAANTFDLARCARSDTFKLIYNCTPHGAVAPVDSKGDPSWKQMTAANAEGKLAPEFVRSYFTSPRPTFELYDLENDPGELHNLSGDPKYKVIEHDLKRALTEKMILDWDFLPAPLR
ncbi:MAG: sulfatase [Verrucomicrobiaceae bacterium]|nr:sulfatase [Verrucomicrobiaceae bacterium]